MSVRSLPLGTPTQPTSSKMPATRCVDTVQELLGHKDVRATMIYTCILQRGGFGIKSPVDS